MTRRKGVATWLVLLALMFVGGLSVSAQGYIGDIGSQLSHTAGPEGADYGRPVDPRTFVIMIIRSLLTLVGTVLFVYIIYAGYLYMTAAGNTEQVEKSTAILRNGVIGLIIIFSSYAITIAATNIAQGMPVGWGTGWAGFVNSFF